MSAIELVSVLAIGIFVGMIVILWINTAFNGMANVFSDPDNAGYYPKPNVPLKILSTDKPKLTVVKEEPKVENHEDYKPKEVKPITPERARLEPPKIEESKFIKSNLKKVQ